MGKKRVKLARNFYYSSSGSIQFRKMIRGELISGRTGLTDPYEVNKLASDIRQKFINEFYELKKPDKKKKPKFKSLLKKFINYKEKESLSPEYLRVLEGNIGVYLKNGIPKNRSKSYQNGVRRDYNIFVRWCIRQGYEVETIKGSTSSEGRMRVLKENELHRILECIPGEDFRDCIEFTYYTGARRKEVNKPKIEWLRKTDNDIYYLQVIKKGGYKRIIRVNNQALNILKRRDFIFWDFDLQWMTRGFKRYSRKANIKDVCFHDLRRTFGYNLLYSGKDMLTVAKLMGISVKVAEKHYLPLFPTQIEDFVL
jgi:integrase